METKVLLALIAGGFSILVALISLITTLFVSQHAYKNNQQLEEFKQSLELKNDELKKSINALNIALQTIQHMKNQVQLILSSVASSLDTKTANEIVSLARQGLFMAEKNKLIIIEVQINGK